MSWTDAAAPVVAEVIRSVGRSDMKKLRKALVAAYPWGERERTPYKAWLRVRALRPQRRQRHRLGEGTRPRSQVVR